jgi:hypothetical protein
MRLENTTGGAEELKSGDETLAYRVVAHINWEPEDIDLLANLYLDADGTEFDREFL